MPIYEYKCSSCGHKKEVLQKMSDAPLTQCPACAKPTLTKLISAAGFQLKGSGWYATDFKGAPRSAKSDGEKADSKGKDEAKAADAGATGSADQAKSEKPKEEKKAESPSTSTVVSPSGQ